MVRHPRACLAPLLLACAQAFAAPYTPANDAVVVERLPLATDPSARRVDSLRKQLAAQPGNISLRIEIARRYFDLAMAQGDPRLIGYAASALAPLEKTAAQRADYWLARGLIEQYSHNFEAALASLDKAAKLDAQSPEAPAWRAAIFMVEARYADAQAECDRLAPIAEPLFGAGCSAYVRAATGQLQAAHDALAAALKAAPQSAPELRLWQYTRLGEMAMRLARPQQAEGYFREALKLGVTDQFLLGAYSDFLLAQKRPAEVMALLAPWERSDVLLLRLALAGQDAKDPRAADWSAQLRDRFQAAGQRGDRLHEQEAARFELDLEKNPAKALALAARNYTAQKEARDAEILMRAALAAKQPKAAQPALDWLRASRYEDPDFAALASKLAAQGATQ
ncbi:MAG: hypothetical protein ABI919_09015 [Ramlibacter sp.]